MNVKSKKNNSKHGKLTVSQSRMSKIGHGIVYFPSKLVEPVTTFLQIQLKKLQKTKKEIAKEDPFKDASRLNNNASPDTDAEEQFGHARTSALREQLDRSIIQTKKALAMIKIGKYGICEDCGKMIDTDRLMVNPDATLCASDQGKREK